MCGVIIMNFRTLDNRLFYFVYYAESVDMDLVFTDKEFRQMT